MMSRLGVWSETAPQIIYQSYPDADLLPIEAPKPGETISQFRVRAENAGDTLFLFLCREADEDIDAQEYMSRLDRAIRDIQSVRDAVREDSPVSPASTSADAKARSDVTIRLSLDADWIELTTSYADSRGRRSGSITSSLHSAEKDDDRLNVAMDAVESLVLAHACAGLDVTDPRYAEGLRTCVEACGNKLHEGNA